MEFLHVYRRVLALLTPERGLAVTLALANLALAGLHFAEPVLFGKVVDVLAGIAGRPAGEVWHDTVLLLTLWGVVGLTGIVANILVALFADRLAHRNRLGAMQRFFEHVLALPLAFHGDIHSGRLLKVMLQGADHLFGLWLAFFREHLETFVTLLVLLPLTLLLNWRLALLLIVLVVLFAVMTTLVIRRTERAQSEVESQHSQLAASASDALANVVVVQSFVRHEAETRNFSDISRKVLRAQFPVLNWWALVSVMTHAIDEGCASGKTPVGFLLHFPNAFGMFRLAFPNRISALNGSRLRTVTFHQESARSSTRNVANSAGCVGWVEQRQER